MSIERYKQIIGEAYENFIYRPDYKAKSAADLMGSQAGQLDKCPTIDVFINKCKTDIEFSENWGLKIEERELSREERYVWYKANTHLIPPHFRNQDKEFEDKYVPTKLITLIYNNETIESYE